MESESWQLFDCSAAISAYILCGYFFNRKYFCDTFYYTRSHDADASESEQYPADPAHPFRAFFSFMDTHIETTVSVHSMCKQNCFQLLKRLPQLNPGSGWLGFNGGGRFSS